MRRALVWRVSRHAISSTQFFTGDALGAGAAVAIIRRKELAVRDKFHGAGATVAINAMSFAQLGLEENMSVRRLRRQAVIREAAPGQFYFDEDAWKALRSMRVRMALLVVGTILLIAIMIAYASAAIQ